MNNIYYIVIILCLIVNLSVILISFNEVWSFSPENNSNTSNAIGNISFIDPASMVQTSVPMDDIVNWTQQDVLLSQIYDKAKNSVVSITTKVNPALIDPSIINTRDLIDIPYSFGSGFVYDNNGHIVTNYHVLKGGTSVDVRFLDGNSYSANLIGKDPYSDLAVLQIDPSALYKQHFIPIPLGYSSSLKIGQRVLSIGNPLGQFSGTMTEGIVSQLNVILTDPENKVYSGVIQFDAPVTHGNSGGPLLNLDGQLIGVTQAIDLEETLFINFAIPSDKVKKIIPELISNGTYKHVWLGISGIDITPDLVKTIGLNDAKGYIVSYVTPDSPADRAGISTGNDANRITINGEDTGINSDADVIIGVDDIQIRHQADLLNYIDSKSVGDTLSIKILRNGNIQNIQVQLEERPSF